MPSIGPLEIFVIAAVALIFLGPEKLPDVARNIARFMTQVRRMASEVKAEFDAGLDEDPDDEVVEDEDAAAIDDAAPEAPRDE